MHKYCKTERWLQAIVVKLKEKIKLKL